MIRLTIALVVIGIALFVWAGSDTLTNLSCKSEPQTISAKDLAANGPGDNHYVRVVDYEFGEAFVYEEENGRWTKAWFPIFSSDDNSAELRLVVATSDVGGQVEADAFGNDGVIEGIVGNNFQSLGSDNKRMLQEDYTVDFDKVYIINHGQSPPGIIWIALKIAGGGILIVIGVLVGVGSMMSK